MPRIRSAAKSEPDLADGGLAPRLAEELKNSRESGQPVIHEQEFPTGKIRVVVVWDEWDQFSLEERTSIILRAYELALGRAYRDRIALASGLTTPEAYAAGMLPFQIITALRSGDSVTFEQCRKAMIDEGGSTLLMADQPQLRYASQREAEAARRRLIDRLPGSDEVWIISRDVGKAEDWWQE